MKRTQFGVTLSYLYDCLILLGFWAAGYVPIVLPVTVATLFTISSAGVYWAHLSRWSLERRDPTLFLPQHLFAIVVSLGVAVAAPQIGFQPIATLFAISAFSFMAPDARSVILSWAIVGIGVLAVIFLTGPRLAMPTATLAGQALTGAVFAGLLARCIWISMLFRALQLRIREKNAALNEAMTRLEALASLDDLTGLPNRRSITRWLEEQMAMCARTSTALTVAVLDLDHFKRINDRFGHFAGDRALQLFASAALETIRETDRLGRHGGEEFLLVLVGTDLRQASEPLERMRRRIAYCDWSPIEPALRVTLTIGAAEYRPGDTADDLIRRADTALYLGKEAGRDRVVLDPTPASRRSQRTTIAAE